MQMHKRSLMVIALTFAMTFAAIPAYSATISGTSCTKAGATKIVSNKKYTCIKSGKKLIWDKGVAIAAAVPQTSAAVQAQLGARMANIAAVQMVADLQRENAELKRALKQRYSFPNIVGKSERMQRILDLVGQVAASRATILITGETGTGKELIAHAIHNLSPRKQQPFVAVHAAEAPAASVAITFVPPPQLIAAAASLLSVTVTAVSATLPALPVRDLKLGALPWPCLH